MSNVISTDSSRNVLELVLEDHQASEKLKVGDSLDNVNLCMYK